MAWNNARTLLTPKEAAARLHVSQWFLNDMRKRGELKSLKIGSNPKNDRGCRRLYDEKEIDDWIERNFK